MLNVLIVLTVFSPGWVLAGSSKTAQEVLLDCIAADIQTCESLHNVITTDISCTPKVPGRNPMSTMDSDPRCNPCDAQDKRDARNAKCADQVTQYCNSIPADLPAPDGCPERDPTKAGKTTVDPQPNPPPKPVPPKPQPPAQPKTPPGQPGTNNQPVTQDDVQAANSNLNVCISAQTKAQDCCANPQNCVSSAARAQQQRLQQMAQQAYANNDSQSLDSVCSEAYQAGDLGSSVNNDYANACMTRHSSCENTCSAYASRWRSRLTNCTGSSCDDLAQIVGSLESTTDDCANLQSLEDQWRSTASSVANYGGIGNYCATRLANNNNPSNQPSQGLGQPASNSSPTNSALAPQSANQNFKVGATECSQAGNIASCLNCADHPDYPSCQHYNSRPDENKTGHLDPSSASEFNNSDLRDIQRAQDASNPSLDRPTNSIKAAALPAAAPSTSLFPPLSNPTDLSEALVKKAKAMANATGKSDLFTSGGERSGGGYHAPQRRGGTTGYEILQQRSPASWNSADKYKGIDLKLYLPGQKYGPKSIFSDRHPDIGTREGADLFQRTSIRIRIICSQGRLRDC